MQRDPNATAPEPPPTEEDPVEDNDTLLATAAMRALLRRGVALGVAAAGEGVGAAPPPLQYPNPLLLARPRPVPR